MFNKLLMTQHVCYFDICRYTIMFINIAYV